ncbi:MAG: alpha-1,2-fucosyltransferase [Rubripirellula sp.]
MKAGAVSLKQRLRLISFVAASRLFCARLDRESEPAKVLIIADCYGRLANRLTVLANVLSYAKEHDWVVVDIAMRQALSGDHLNPQHHLAGSLIFNDRGKCRQRIAKLIVAVWGRYRKEVERVSYREPAIRFAGLPILRGDGETRIDLKSLQKTHPNDRCIVLTGIFLETDKPNPATLADLRETLKPNAKDLDFALDVLSEIESGTTIVGVHVRHGDYRTWRDGCFYHPFESYVQAMQKMQQSLDGKTVFLVVSDEEQDMSLCPSSLDVRRIRGSETQDLVLLSKCDYIIATHSSFANWASFYAEVPILTMRDAMKPDPVDLTALKVVDFPRLQGDYLV